MLSHENPDLCKPNLLNLSSFHTHAEYIFPYISILFLSTLVKILFPMVIMVDIN